MSAATIFITVLILVIFGTAISSFKNTYTINKLRDEVKCIRIKIGKNEKMADDLSERVYEGTTLDGSFPYGLRYIVRGILDYLELKPSHPERLIMVKKQSKHGTKE